jgi:hypothetical protein
MPAPTFCERLSHPLALALVLTLANAGKPVVIDDTAYLLFARHVSQHPLDPYGFALFWWERPEPAMTILLPPVVPCWLAAGIALFGEHLFLLKLWLFPFAAVLAYAARSLVRRFVSRDHPAALAVLVVGPGVLPFFNFMLDVPALALQLAAVALVACGRGWRAFVLAGVCLGLAVQTKYSVLGLPVVLLMVGWQRRAWLPAAAAVAVGVGLFATWEVAMWWKYGQSHFVFHATRKAAGAGLTEKVALVLPLLSHLGLTASWIGLLALARRHSPRVAAIFAAVVGVLLLWVLFAPGRWNVIAPNSKPGGNPLTVAAVLFPILGGLALATGIAFAVVGVVRKGFAVRRSLASWFLLGWLMLELSAYFTLTPFPAGRRVIGVTFVLALVTLRIWVRLKERAIAWPLAAGLALGGVATAVDCWDAQPERAIPQQAAAFARDRGWAGQAYFVGHWGFQYYADRAGMQLVEPGASRLRAGDWLVLPVYPDEFGFYRPHHGDANVELKEDVLVQELEIVWDDFLHAQTIPNLYGGRTPINSRFHPRQRVRIYRVTADWVPRRAAP